MIDQDPARAVAYLQSLLPGVRFTDAAFGFTQVVNGVPNAAVVYDMYGYTNAFIHCAGTPGKPWLSKEFLHKAFDLPFRELNFMRLTAWVEADNDASLRFVTRLGFRLEAMLPGAGTVGQPVMLFSMFRQHCRWLESTVGQEHEVQVRQAVH